MDEDNNKIKLIKTDAKSSKSSEEAFDYGDYHFNEKGEKLIRKKVSAGQARRLVRRYEGQLHSKKEGEEYDKWKKQVNEEGKEFTEDPWDKDDDEYWVDTDDEEKMKKRIELKELYGKRPLEQLFDRYVHDESGKEGVKSHSHVIEVEKGSDSERNTTNAKGTNNYPNETKLGETIDEKPKF